MRIWGWSIFDQPHFCADRRQSAKSKSEMCYISVRQHRSAKSKSEKVSRARAGTYPSPHPSIIPQKRRHVNTFFLQIFLRFLLTNPFPLYILYSMKNENKRPTKKALVQALLDKGVDKKIVDSLQRANIDTMQFVLKAIS